MGITAALGGMTAMVALLTGLSTARADELADLKANQELLKQRIDQLALGAPAPVPPGAPSMAGSFPRSFLIPGTDTSLLIGGYVKLDAAYWMSGGSPNGNAATSLNGGAPVASSTPLDLHGTGIYAAPAFNPHSRGATFQMTAKESRLRVETRTPTAWGQAQTVFELDFYGCQAGGIDCANLNQTSNANVPRLRLAYGTLGGFIAGQAFVPVFDLDAHPELFDFGGDVGVFGYARAPQVGYKWELPWGMSLGTYAVYPSTVTDFPVGQLATESLGTGVAGTSSGPVPLTINPNKNTYPDFDTVLRWQQPWGHFQVSGVLTQLELQDGRFISKQYVGYGGGFGMNVKPDWFGWAKDNIGAEFFAGEGLGHYASDGTGTDPFATPDLASNFGGCGVYIAAGTVCGAGTALYGNPAGPTSAAAAALIRATTITEWGGQANYQHWWAPNLRSTVSAGVLHFDVPTLLLGGATSTTLNYNKEIMTAHANLIWSPVAFINTGIEYTFAHRTTVLNVKGDQNVIDFAFQVKF